jgi:tetratricopeptide (TPR) repeat protein
MVTKTFRRFQAPDPEALAAEIAAARGTIAAAQRDGDNVAELAQSSGLGTMLYIAGREDEAAALLAQALEMARAQNNTNEEIYCLYNLATAEQYLGRREAAQIRFAQALVLAQTAGIHQHDHFVLHHQGRCHAELGEMQQARRCFEAALALRQALGEEGRIKSTEAALTELAAWELE